MQPAMRVCPAVEVRPVVIAFPTFAVRTEPGKSSQLILEPPDSQPITARLAAAASRRSDLETLLAAAPPDASIDQFRQLVINENVAGKGSAVSRQKLWGQLRQRYLLDRLIPECAAFLSAMASTSSTTDRGLICLVMMARADRLFREVTLRAVSTYLSRDGTVMAADQLQAELEGYLQERGVSWSSETVLSVQQHLLAALKDFGVLRGSRPKRTVRPRPGSQVTLPGQQVRPTRRPNAAAAAEIPVVSAVGLRCRAGSGSPVCRCSRGSSRIPDAGRGGGAADAGHGDEREMRRSVEDSLMALRQKVKQWSTDRSQARHLGVRLPPGVGSCHAKPLPVLRPELRRRGLAGGPGGCRPGIPS